MCSVCLVWFGLFFNRVSGTGAGAGRGRGDEPHDRVDEALRLDLQQQVVRGDVHHPLPQQEGPLRGEDSKVVALHLLPRVPRCGRRRKMFFFFFFFFFWFSAFEINQVPQVTVANDLFTGR